MVRFIPTWRIPAVYKNLAIAVLLTACFLVANRSTGLPASPTSPTIVKQVLLPNQTTTIPTTTLFTPGTTGLFRISAYMTQVVAGDADDGWTYNLGWSDDAGAETTFSSIGALSLSMSQTPPQAWGSMTGVGSVGDVFIFEAVAGKPITFSVSNLGRSGSDGTYSLYFTVERL
jgi:hypothetical protein